MFRYFGFTVVLILAVGCGKQPAEPASDVTASTTPVAFNASGAPTVEFSVPDMMCPEGCGAKVKEILAGQPGAKDVKIDFESKIAIVAVDKEKFDSKQAVAALVDHQFGHSTLKDSAAASPADAKSVQ
jgi:copper chaperone CopZ